LEVALSVRLEIAGFDLEEVLTRAALEGARVALKDRHAADSRWMSVESAAAYLDMSEDAIRGLLKRGQLIAHRPLGVRRVFISRTEADAWARGEAG
jgi:excisionase family DNA binding protein